MAKLTLSSVTGGEPDPRLPDYPTIVHAFEATCARIPDRIAMWDGDRSITYAEYHRAVAGLSRRLEAQGVRGGRVAVIMRNSIEGVIAAISAMAAGAQVAPMNPFFPPKAMQPLLADVEARTVIADTGSSGMMRPIAEALGIGNVELLGPDGLTLEEISSDPALTLPDPPTPEDHSILYFTGGTTGLPKGASHTHASIMAFCKSMNSLWQYGFDCERMLDVAPLFHIWGNLHLVVQPVYLGASLDIVAEYKPDVILERFEKNKITVFAGGPAAMYIGLTAAEKFASTDFSHLKRCVAGGSACPEGLLRRWEETVGTPILEGCGMSEGAPTAGNPSEGLQKPGSVGIVPPLTTTEIVDLETGETVLPRGERGEIRIRGPQFIKEYRNRPEETANAIRDGWLYTGDIGVMDEDGYLFMVDRKKEMLIVGGYNVYPREVEEVLTNHPAILEAAVIGAPDEFRGETVKAVIAFLPGQSATKEEILAHCKDHLVKYKLPTIIEVMDALPKTGPGKIDKLTLKGER
jgi:long-chain acyl-CoA synthetase